MTRSLVSLDNLDRAKALIEQASTSQLKEIISKAAAMRVYSQQAKRGLEIQNQCAEIKLRAEKRLGNLLKEMPKDNKGGDRKSQSQCTTVIPTLKDLGLDKYQSSRYQAVASLPDKEFEKHIAEVKKSNEELTTVGVIKLARDLKQADRITQDPAPPPITKTQGPKEFINNVIVGDCLEVLKLIPDNSIDSMVTDPPAGIGFMGKEWDSDKGGRDKWIEWMATIMRECNRVLKPGGHALVWSLPRTSHWTAFALEDAGFEIRDCVYHLFGTGFPKSLNISKAIEKHKGIKAIGRKDPTGGMMGEGMYKKGWNRTRNALIMPEIQTEEGKQWQGWGTGVKPAVECWWLVRKQFSEKSAAENILKWGVGGLNIDGCRVETDEIISTEYGQPSGTDRYNWNLEKKKIEKQGFWNTKGRFPANLIHDGSPVVLAEFAKAGVSKSVKNKKADQRVNDGNSIFLDGVHNPENSYSDEGSPARFFYSAKASKAERDLGLENMEAKAGIRTNAPRENEVARTKPTKNNHPTVKAQALMQYLIKLITPPNGIVLDCFAGSGSTLVAAKTLGHPFIGIEKFQGYVDIAKARLNNNH